MITEILLRKVKRLMDVTGDGPITALTIVCRDLKLPDQDYVEAEHCINVVMDKDHASWVASHTRDELMKLMDRIIELAHAFNPRMGDEYFTLFRERKGWGVGKQCNPKFPFKAELGYFRREAYATWEPVEPMPVYYHTSYDISQYSSQLRKFKSLRQHRLGWKNQSDRKRRW